ncbi:hypothetical protein ACG2F4_07625 [Halalkalibaculum sp. DA3122]|uniref:hypothetical protein n=1 Tax=Halalkalibaculum sp. DA3122 TaxID=3373607 RepID=UPI00375417B3
MATFLDFYKGASIFEVSEVDPSEGETLRTKLIAKAVLQDQPNMKVDFVEQAATPVEAREKIKNAIDRFLDEHDITQFENNSLIDSEE